MEINAGEIKNVLLAMVVMYYGFVITSLIIFAMFARNVMYFIKRQEMEDALDKEGVVFHF